MRLSTGLLKKLYLQHEDVLYLKKRDYLNERERYLDDQLKGYINEERNMNSKDLDLMLCIKAVGTFESKYSRMDQIKLVKDAFSQIFLDTFLHTLFHLILRILSM